jgi:myosin heavy subunit
MLIRITLIIAIIAGLAAGALNFVKVKEKVTTIITQRDEWHGKYDTTYADLTKTKSELATTKQDLSKTRAELASTKDQRDKAVAEAAVQSKRAADATDKLVKATQERDTAQADLAAYKGTGRTPQQILTLDKQLKDAQDLIDEANAVIASMAKKTNQLQARLDIYEHPERFVTAPANLKGKIEIADPKWDFVILDIGEDQGVLENCEFLVSRNGQLVAKVKVTSVQKGRSVANVLPGPWKIGEVVEGDQVIPAHPAS